MKLFIRSFRKNIKTRGFALVTVLLLTSLLLIMMLALISLTSHTLYRTTADVERNSIVPLAEAAINEALMNLNSDTAWGTDGSKKLIFCRNQSAKIAGFKNEFSNSDTNNDISYENDGFFYITFDKNDSAFSGTKYYSVNRLEDPNTNTVYSWRGKPVKKGTASIIVTVAFGNTVKHIEAIIAKTFGGGTMTCGSRGSMDIDIDNFILQTENGDLPFIHSNFDSATDPGVTINSKNISIVSEGCVSASSTIKVNNKTVDPNTNPSFIPKSAVKAIPVLTVSEIEQYRGITSYKALPAGTYKAYNNKLYYNSDDDTSEDMTSENWKELDNNTIKNYGLSFDGNSVILNSDIKVISAKDERSKDDRKKKDSDGYGSTGNLTIIDTPVDLNTYTIYTYGREDRKYEDGRYDSGNLTIKCSNAIDDVLYGQGNIYCEGELSLTGKSISGGSSSDQVCLYSNGDINVNCYEDTVFYGLIYTCGDFFVTMDSKGASEEFKNGTKRLDNGSKDNKRSKGEGKVKKGGKYVGPQDGDEYKNDSNEETVTATNENGVFLIKGTVIVAGTEGDSNNPGVLKIKEADNTYGGTFDIIYNENSLDNLVYSYSKKGASNCAFVYNILSWHEF